MIQLALKFVLPLTVISFTIFTKWWYVLVVDGPDEILTGFPLPFVCKGFHTSMSLQFFISELLIDFLTYFSFWFIIIFCINRFLATIKMPKILTIVLLTLTGLILGGATIIVSNPDNLFYFKRGFDMEIMETGYKFMWDRPTRPDFYKYHPELKKNK